MDAIERVFSDREYCLRQLRIAREIFSSRKTTVNDFRALESALTLLYLHCPEDIKLLALGTLEETITRRVTIEIHASSKSNPNRNGNDPVI